MNYILKKLRENFLLFAISELLCLMLLGLSAILGVHRFIYLLLGGLFIFGFFNVLYPIWFWFGAFVFLLQVVALWNLIYGISSSLVYLIVLLTSIMSALALRVSVKAEDGAKKEMEVGTEKKEGKLMAGVSSSETRGSPEMFQQDSRYLDEISYLNAEVRNNVISEFEGAKQKHKSISESCKIRMGEISGIIDTISDVYSILLNTFQIFSSYRQRFKEFQLRIKGGIDKIMQEFGRFRGVSLTEPKIENKAPYDHKDIQTAVSEFRGIVDNLSSYFEKLEIKKMYDNVNSLYNAITFLKLLVNEVQGVINNSFSVSLKIMQLSSSSGDIGVRRSLMVILQDMGSILFKFSVYVKNFRDAVYDFSSNLENFTMRISEIERSMEEIRRALLLVGGGWKNGVQPKIPLFMEKVEQLIHLQENAEIFDKLQGLASSTKEFISASEKFSGSMDSLNLKITEIDSMIENFLNSISELLRRFYTIKSEFEKVLEEIKSIQDKLPYISENDLASPLFVKDVSKLISDITEIKV